MEVHVARIKRFFKEAPSNPREHPTAAECGYSTAAFNGKRYLQLSTYGSDQRKYPGKVSQTIQLDRKAAQELSRLIGRSFDLNG
jgi:hypothetical protein